MLKGNITFSTVTSSHEPSHVAIRVEDESSGILFLEMRMSFEDFGRAIAHSCQAPILFRLNNIDDVGKVCELKQVRITIQLPEDNRIWNERDSTCLDILDTALAEHLVGGWFTDRSRAFNHHYLTYKGNNVSVELPFWRYVDPS